MKKGAKKKKQGHREREKRGRSKGMEEGVMDKRDREDSERNERIKEQEGCQVGRRIGKKQRRWSEEGPRRKDS